MIQLIFQSLAILLQEDLKEKESFPLPLSVELKPFSNIITVQAFSETKRSRSID